MSTEVVARPSIPQHRSRTWFVGVVALAVGLAAGAGIVAVTRADSSTSDTNSRPVAAAPVVAGNSSCLGDGGYLLAEVAAVPSTDAARLVNDLSPRARALLRSSALTSAWSSTMPVRADPATLAAVLSRLGDRDATAIRSGLAQTGTAIGSVPAAPQPCG
jgi:hypothetical protein